MNRAKPKEKTSRQIPPFDLNVSNHIKQYMNVQPG